MAIKKKCIFIAAIIAALFMALGLCLFTAEAREASAISYTTAKYLTNGRTTNETSVTSGCPDNFKVYMYGSSNSGTGTLWQGTALDWSTVNITVETSKVSDHLSFQLLRNGTVYTTKKLSGSGNISLYAGSLSDGKYELQYSCRYAPSFLVDFTYYFYTFQFEIDKTAPTYTVKTGDATLLSGGYTNEQIVYAAKDENFEFIKYRRPNTSSYFTLYSSSYIVAANEENNGLWYFYAEDEFGHASSTFSVYLDTVAPTGKVSNASGVTTANNGYTNTSFKYTATDQYGLAKYEIKKAGSSSWTSYTAGTLISGTNGWYSFRATDKAGNVSDEYKVYYDQTKPTGTLYGGTATKASGSCTNAAYVKYVASDSHSGIANCYVKQPGSSSYTSYVSGSHLSAEGKYTFKCIDRSGNESDEVTITLDKTKPTGAVYGGISVHGDAAFTNADYVKYAASDSISGIASCYVKKPGASSYVSYTNGTQLTVEGAYSFYSVDKAGNQSDEVTITLDKTKPAGTLYGGTSICGSRAFTNAEYIKYVASDNISGVAKCYVKTPGKEDYSDYTSGALLMAEGVYSFYCEDWAGNKSETVTLTLDKTSPAGKLYGGASEIQSGSYTNAGYIKYSASDSLSGVSACYVKKPNANSFESYTSGTQLTAEGTYSFYCIDRSQNQSVTVTVTLDRTKPTGTLYGGTAVKTSGAYTNTEYIKYIAADNVSGLAGCYVKMPGSSSYMEYAGGTLLATEGTYSFYSVDRSGNKSETVTITLDNTDPAGTLYGGENPINSGDATNAAYIKFIAQDETALAAVFVKLPGESGFVSYASGTELTEEGTYEFYAADKAGNVSETYTVVLDRRVPAAQLYADEEPFRNNGYTNGAHIKFESDAECFVKLPGSDNFVPYLSGVEYYKPGKYVFYAVSKAGTSTGEYSIIIDRTEKVPEISNVTDGKTDGDVTLKWENGDPEQFAPVVSVTVNGRAYAKGAVIYTIDTGTYEVVCTDAAGNVWTAEFASSKQNVLTQTLQKEYWEACNADGEYFAFASYESAFEFAVGRENTFVRTGEWNSESWDTGIAMDAKDSVNAANGIYSIYKKSGNPEEEVAYFTRERLDEVIAEYAKLGIENYYYWEKAPAVISDGENLYSYSDGKTILANAVQLGENISCLLNGEAFTGKTVETEGRNILTVTDAWGNECEYELIIVRTAPVLLYAAGEGSANIVTFDRTYYFKDAVTVSVTDAYDEMAMFNVYDGEGVLIGSCSLGETFTIEGSGIYTVEAVNHFGKSQIFSLIISRNAPEIGITENGEDKVLEIIITESADEESHIQTLEIYKSIDGGESWTLLTTDDYGTAISVENLVYRFRTSGLYKAVVTDEFRTGIDAVTVLYEYEQSVPDGFLTGVKNGGYTNGTVKFEWTDEAVVVVKKDGKVIEYTSGKKLTEDGVYEITFENFDGYKATYTFTIDTVAPEVTLNGVNDGETVNCDVSAVFEGEGVTAELFKDGKSLGAYAPGTVIAEDGAYKIIVTDLAQNKTEAAFTIDKTVDFAVNINDKGLANSVTVTANEEVSLVLMKNGEEVEYKLGDAITEPAAYVLTVTDAFGNKAEMSFTVVEPLVQKFEYNFDNMPGFEKVLVNGEEKRLNYGTLELFEDGMYEVGVVVNGKSYTFTVAVDGTAPTLKLNGVENGGTTTGNVVLSEPSETADIKVYRGEEEIGYKLGETISEEGEYRVTVTDECGNSTVYTFTIESGTNWTLIVLLVVLGLLVAGGVVFFFIRRKKTADQDEA